MNNIDKLVDLEKKIQYKFQNFGLLEMAMRHSSYANEHHMERLECNERLEFLGDAVLEVVSSEFLYKTFPRLPEGEMTKKRASLVCEPALAFCAREIDLGSFLLLGKGEEATGGRHRDSIVSDAMEATIGAIFLDGGFEPAKAFVLNYILNDIEHKQLFYDSKTILQELIQGETDEEIVKRRGTGSRQELLGTGQRRKESARYRKGQNEKSGRTGSGIRCNSCQKKSVGELCISNPLKCRDLSRLPTKPFCSSTTVLPAL